MIITVNYIEFEVPNTPHPIYDGLSWEDVIKEYIIMKCSAEKIKEYIKKDAVFLREMNIESILDEER